MARRKTREEIKTQDKWNIEKMYPDNASAEKDLKESVSDAEKYGKYKGHLADSAESLADALIESDRIEQKLERAFVYSRMKLDEDNRAAEQQALYSKAAAAISQVSSLTSFVMPELIRIPEETLKQFIEDEPRLQTYRHLLDSAMRQKDHVLSEKEENILAQLGEVLSAPDQVFTMLNDADMKFGKIKDEEGKETELTHGNYISFMRSQNRQVRKDAYTHCYEAYKGMINTISANYSANVKTDVISARLRNYPSARAAALSGGKIPESVYDNLIDSVHSALPKMYEYVKLRKKLLGLDELKMYDIYVPLVKLPKKKIRFQQAVEIGKEGLAPLGEAYLQQFQKGIDSRWIDIYETEGKTSGAYSFGSYDSDPYVLMNFDSTLEDVFTLVHEMGHSMNSWLTRKTQPYVYGGHSIFTAEVASTVNETLLMKHLLKTESDPEMKKYILNMYLDAFKGTLFRQTMFAEFEKKTHEYVENGGGLTADWMNKTYDELNTEYFGPALSHDDYIQYEWARIPHFYNSFYVYQYATGYSAANAIADRILNGGEKERDDYLKFLSLGSSDYPVELLKVAGVDMSEREPVDRAMKVFSGLVDEFAELMEK
jgi:oligoendopeptidase F